MTENKPIIIDGVDVSKCGFFHLKEYGSTDCHIALAFSEEYDGCIKCELNPNCYFKQLARKTQECEELKREIDIRSCANIELSLEFKKYKKAIDEIEEIADNNYENPEMERIFTIIGGLDV